MQRCRAVVGQSRGDRGSIAPLVPIVMVALFMLGGLVVDGSRDLNARGDAQAFAEEAARAGATAVDLKQATLTLDPNETERRANAYCDAIKTHVVASLHADVTVKTCKFVGITTATRNCTPSVPPADIVVNTEVQLTVQTTLLGFIGVSEFTVSGQAKARPYEGTNAQNAC